jgi:hypothetical protein
MPARRLTDNDPARPDETRGHKLGRRTILAVLLLGIGLVVTGVRSPSTGAPEGLTRSTAAPLHRPAALAGGDRFERPAGPQWSGLSGALRVRLPQGAGSLVSGEVSATIR